MTITAQTTSTDLGYVNRCAYCDHAGNTLLGEENWFWARTEHGMVCAECKILLERFGTGEFEADRLEIQLSEGTITWTQYKKQADRIYRERAL